MIQLNIKTYIEKFPFSSLILKEGSAVLFVKLLSVVSVFMLHLYISNEYGATVNGVFTLFITIITILSVLTKMGFDTSIVKQMSVFKINNQYSSLKYYYKKTVLIVLFVSILLSTLLLLLNEYLISIFFNNESQIDFRWMAILLPFFSLLSINSESMRGMGKIKFYLFFQNFSIFALSFIFILLFHNFFTSNIQLVIFSFICSVVLLFLFSNIGPFKSILNLKESSKIDFKPYFKESYSMLLSNSIFFLMTWSDILMISYFLPESETGVYSNASKIANLSVFFLFSINTIAAPKLAAFNASKDIKSLRKFTKETSRISMLLSAPVLLFILLFPEFFLGLFGKEFVIAKYSLIILALGQFVNAASGSVVNVLNMTGKEKTAKNIILISAIINVLLNLILIPKYGILGAAIATTTSTIIWNLLAVYFIKRYFNFISITLPWQKI